MLPSSPAVNRPHIRIRDGENRLTGADNGLCEFVFRTDRETSVIVYVHVRYADDCGNSLRLSMDGGQAFGIGNKKEFGEWLWEHSMRLFRGSPGFHRLTIQTREDGLELDRVVIRDLSGGARQRAMSLADGALDALPVTPPPVFEGLPPAAPHLPAIGPVTAQVFASDSLVIGTGHRNTLTVFLRLNGRCKHARQSKCQYS